MSVKGVKSVAAAVSAVVRSQALTQAPLQLKKEVCRSPLHQAAASPLQQPRTHFGLRPLRFNPQECLKGKIQAAADHSEIIPGPVDYSETQVVSPADVPGESDFETGSELREHFSLAAEMISLRIDEEGVWRPLGVKLVSFAAAENRAYTSPCIGRQTRARNWITQRKCAKDSADGMIVIDSLFNKDRDGLVLEDIETRLGGVQGKSLKPDTSIATEEIFNVAAASQA